MTEISSDGSMSALDAQEIDGGRERLGVAATAAHLEHAEHTLVAPDGDADLFRVAVSMPRISTSPLHERRQVALQTDAPRVGARGVGPTGTIDNEGVPTSSSGIGLELFHHGQVVTQRRGDHITPFDEQDAVRLGQLCEAQIGHLVRAVGR